MRYGHVALGVAAMFLVVACGGSGPSQTGTIPDQLEALSVEPNSGSGAVAKTSGTLTVTGADRDYVLTLAGSGTPLGIKVHTPGASPLAKLAADSMTIETTEGGFGGPSLFVADGAGPMYVGVFGDGSGLADAEARLGKGFVRRGDEVASETDGTFVWSYRKAIFKTDSGDVSVDPGDVKTIVLNGTTWRAVVIASYETGTNPDATELPGCGPESMLGFELFRLATPPAVVEAPRRRLSSATVAFAGCTAPGGGGE
jgi:hypothetical protein